MRVYDRLKERIILSIPRAAEETGLTWPTVNGAFRRLRELGIAREVSGRTRDRVFVYQRQLDLLNGRVV